MLINEGDFLPYFFFSIYLPSEYILSIYYFIKPGLRYLFIFWHLDKNVDNVS